MPFDGTEVTNPAIELLEKAHDLLKKKGWVQNSFVEYEDEDEDDDDNAERKEVAYCLIGAINHFEPTPEVLNQCIGYLGFNDDDDTIEWNDDDKRTKSGVLRRLTLRINKAKQSLLLKV